MHTNALTILEPRNPPCVCSSRPARPRSCGADEDLRGGRILWGSFPGPYGQNGSLPAAISENAGTHRPTNTHAMSDQASPLAGNFPYALSHTSSVSTT